MATIYLTVVVVGALEQQPQMLLLPLLVLVEMVVQELQY